MREGDRALGRTKCCRTVTERFSSVVLHSFLSAGFREARAAPRNARVLPAVPPSYPRVRRRTGIGICFASLIGCNRLGNLHTFLNIHIFVSLCSVSGSARVFCVDGPCSRVFVCPYVRKCPSLFSPSITCSSVQDPGGPASFYTHARNNAITCEILIVKFQQDAKKAKDELDTYRAKYENW